MLLPLGRANNLLLLIGDTVDGLVSLFIKELDMLEPPRGRGEEEKIWAPLVLMVFAFAPLIVLSPPIFLSSCGVSYRPTFLMVEFLDIQKAICEM